MFFTSVQLYRLHDASEMSLAALEEALNENPVRPLGGSEATRMGWRAPGGRKSSVLAHEVQGQRLMSALHQERILPGSVVREEVEERCEEREAAEGRPVPRKEKQAIKEQVMEELLPRAFIRSQKIDLWWDTQRQLIGVNATTRKKAENVLDLLRQTLGSLKVTPLATKKLPIRAMTDWLKDASTRPSWLSLNDMAVLSSSSETTFTAKQADLEGEEVQTMLENGCHASKLAVIAEGQASFTLTDDLALKSIKFDNQLLDEASQTNDDGDAIIRMETDFSLMTSCLGELIDQLITALDGEATSTAPDNAEAA